MHLPLKQATNKVTTSWNRWLGNDGLPSVVGSTSPSIKWSESIREIKNRHYNLPKVTQQLPKQISFKSFKTSVLG